MDIDQPSLALLDLGKAVLKVDPPRTNRLNLRPRQDQPRLHCIDNGIVVAGFLFCAITLPSPLAMPISFSYSFSLLLCKMVSFSCLFATF